MNNYPESVIQMRDVTKRFGEVNAVNNVSLDVPHGCYLWFYRAQWLRQDNDGTSSDRKLWRNRRHRGGLGKSPENFKRRDQKRIGYMPQFFILYPELTIWENLNFAASIYGHTMNRRQRLEELLELVELTGH